MSKFGKDINMRTTDIADLLKDITPEQLSALAIGLDSIASRPKRIDTSYVSRINRMTQRYFEATKYWRPYYMTTEAYNKECCALIEQLRSERL